MMGRFKKEIPVSVNENTHVVAVDPKMFSADIYIDNTFLIKHKYTGASGWFGANEDVPVVIDGVTYIAAIRSGGYGVSVRLAIDGKYINSEDIYVPAVDRPAWAIVFLILCFGSFVWGGLIWACSAALIGISLCTKVINSSMKNGAKIFACSAIVLGAWAVTYLISLLFGSLLSFI